MQFLLIIIDGLIRFVRRNPLTVLLILVLAVGAPALLKGIATVILYILLGFVFLIVILALLFRWRIYSVRRQMEEQFGARAENAGQRTAADSDRRFGGFGHRSESTASQGREGEVKVHRTSGVPDKRVASDVGDYVDFEETKK